jgi:hypothetical protein
MIKIVLATAIGVSAATWTSESVRADGPPISVKKSRISKCGPQGCYPRRLCPDGYSCYSLYGAYGPYGGSAYWGAYTYVGWGRRY